MSAETVLEVANLCVGVGAQGEGASLVRDVSFSMRRGEIVGVVGESGCGKSMTALAIADLLPVGVTSSADRLSFEGVDLTTADRRTALRTRGLNQAVVFQDPQASLNPALKLGTQMTEAVMHHQRLPRASALRRAAENLSEVKIAGAEQRLREYPYQLSGGMRQRAMIAMGLMMSPSLLIADEPTTALDVTVQADVMRMLRRLNAEHETAILLVSHHIALLQQVCSRILVMYAGELVEDLPSVSLVKDARHPYTRALIASVPSLAHDPSRRLVTIPGTLPDPGARGDGCPFRNRCNEADERCDIAPPLTRAGDHRVACWRAEENAHA
ncbi:oligopeptide/dipeptide ABC transporter, ATP-binding protein, C-terminal domain-containing protein [Aeromicrobium choanae]|uniref:Oligopeptide/dipeptide ABC transporter, ATP-binding protein, C-terminal domain-containing protein n=2 Tax=Aeromicrobium choanae TaxID=1736691 RepID=A0A1T4YX26_9ACTN|nr:oligopeptide/dipeptide ABC transporter, ATP-binding protein, C-terminal domain-containing protein [Aeromicrobium choanae]